MTDEKVDEIFDSAFVSVTKKLSSLDLKRGLDRKLEEDVYTGSVFTLGVFEAFVFCDISSKLYDYIVYEMSDGCALTAEDKLLYIKEYMNIVCGYAVSKINNELGSACKISVPVFDSMEQMIAEAQQKPSQDVIFYETDVGMIRVSVYYT